MNSFIESTKILDDPKVIDLFTKLGVYSKVELSANRRILEELYIKKVGIEVRTMLEMTRKDVLPAMLAQLKFCGETAAASGKHCPAYLTDLIKNISSLTDAVNLAYKDLEETYEAVDTETNPYLAGMEIYTKVNAKMEALRSLIDRYETVTTREFYRLPLYEDMLFSLQ